MSEATPRPRLEIAFPVQAIPGIATIVQHNGASRRCAQRLWVSPDWYEARRRGPDGRARAHHAQDIFAPSGSLFLAPEAGTVIGSSADTGPTPRGGHWLRLRGADGRVWYAAHLLEAPERTGVHVDAGELLGLVGRSGNAQHVCPHLHLGLKVHGRPVNYYAPLQRALAALEEGQSSPPAAAPRERGQGTGT